MARKKQSKKISIVDQVVDPEPTDDMVDGSGTEGEQIGIIKHEPTEIECGLPNKDLFRMDEVARYFDVSDRTIRLWIDHGKLTAEKYHHAIRVTRASILSFRLKSRMNTII